MDPITQGALGAVAAQSFVREENKSTLGLALVAGALGGMAADLDVFIRSDSDPLLFLEFHRHFTHSLIFIPAGGLLVALALLPFMRKRVGFLKLYLMTTIGYATHGLLDACTSYGTMLWWPFTNERVSWDNVGIVDPVATLALIVAMVVAFKRGSRLIAQLGLAFFISYLLWGVVQRERAEAVIESTIAQRGHSAERLTVKPTIGNLILWRSIYEHAGLFYVDAVRVPIAGESKVIVGSSVEKLDPNSVFPELPNQSRQREDIRRFAWFSDDYIGKVPGHENMIGDVRYAMVPNDVDPLWGIVVDPNQPESHVEYRTLRGNPREKFGVFLNLLFQ
ncbi:MAG TPA: metal-dependent hydrolase [Bdellovibrionales bacterium]|nr:metal-dependent hydrolase [Bdellovibrionales bacterium]